MPGASVVESVFNSYVNTVREMSPELAKILIEGHRFPEISERVTELAKEIVSIKNAKPDEKQSIIEKVSSKIDSIKNISEGAEKLTPYAKLLYNGLRAFGVNLPEWN